MAKKDKQKDPNLPEELPEEELTETAGPVPEEPPKDEPKETPKAPEVNWEEKYNAEHDSYLRLAAEFDNFRKRTAKEKDQSYGNGKSDAVAKLLPIYDNLERALNQPTEDAAYKRVWS